MSFFSMSITVLKSLFSKPSTVRYPFEKKAPVKNSRGTIGIEIDKCIFCGICAKKCPPNAIVVTKADKKWEINRYKCISCNSCVEVCPKKCLTNTPGYSAAFTSKEKPSMIHSHTQTAAPAPKPQ